MKGRPSDAMARALTAVAVVAMLVSSVVMLPTSGSAGADPSPEVSSAVERYTDTRARLEESDRALRSAQREATEERRRWEAAEDAKALASRRLEAQRERHAQLSADAYMRQGSADRSADDSMTLALSGVKEAVQRAQIELGDATDAADERADALAASEREVEAARAGRAAVAADVDASRTELDTAIAAVGVSDISAVAYLAYQRGAQLTGERHPACHLSAAVLAGIGRIASVHGQNGGARVDDSGVVAPRLRGLRGDPTPDTDGGRLDDDPTADVASGPLQVRPATWVASGVDGDGDGVASVDDLFDSAATMGEVLCSSGADLSSFDPLSAAVSMVLGDGQQAAVALGVARRYAQVAALDLGTVPIDPRTLVIDGEMQFDGGDTTLLPGDVEGMIAWAMTRLGTPYSQCLGPSVRPQDPVCPDGTNRFGSGFFDCSGFVSHAYRLIGLRIPQTTYAMEASAAFMATKVSSGIDLRVMQPGDVFLMDGHTGMYVGGGMIVHAIGRGLTFEPVPAWVANGTFAVLRPALLLGASAPVG